MQEDSHLCSGLSSEKSRFHRRRFQGKKCPGLKHLKALKTKTEDEDEDKD
jgi:hypothetical protein